MYDIAVAGIAAGIAAADAAVVGVSIPTLVFPEAVVPVVRGIQLDRADQGEA